MLCVDTPAIPQVQVRVHAGETVCMVLLQRRHQGNSTIVSLLIRGRQREDSPTYDSWEPVFLWHWQSQPGLLDKTGSCSRQKHSCSGPQAGLPVVRKIPSHVISTQNFTHPKQARDYCVPEEQGTRSLHIKTLGTSHLVIDRKRKQTDKRRDECKVFREHDKCQTYLPFLPFL